MTCPIISHNFHNMKDQQIQLAITGIQLLKSFLTWDGFSEENA